MSNRKVKTILWATGLTLSGVGLIKIITPSEDDVMKVSIPI